PCSVCNSSRGRGARRARAGPVAKAASCWRNHALPPFRCGVGVGTRMTGSRIALSLGAAVVCAVAALVAIPLAVEADTLLYAQDDPVRLADHALDRSFTAAVAAREIEAALAADDLDLAESFLDLARDRNVPVDPELLKKVEAANSAAATATRMAGSFGRG